ncbi:L-fucose dehydrogenase isoform X3 [Gadus morhua]|uniref:L-fucose dehydrogenase isoform X3 n=1 Tax=Gadus morhua TaxID=8049 RepID=UPI0011B51DFB|nr:17-beta-hydroxysteroid dehydrogenase 14 isoform X3 [Gadus morhua]
MCPKRKTSRYGQRLIEATVQLYGQLDCLVNNAGWHPPHKETDETSAEEFKDLLNLNLISYFLASKFALPHLRKTEGNIINISSLVASLGQVGAVPYVATKVSSQLDCSRSRCSVPIWSAPVMSTFYHKGAIISMTKAMAVDESRFKVRVNCISPGNVLTPLWEELADQTPDATAALKAGADCQLIGRMGTEEESGLMALFLAADATFCTGVDLPLSGGAELNYGFKNRLP